MYNEVPQPKGGGRFGRYHPPRGAGPRGIDHIHELKIRHGLTRRARRWPRQDLQQDIVGARTCDSFFFKKKHKMYNSFNSYFF